MGYRTNNNGHIGWLSSMQKLGLDGLFAAMNFIPAEMTRQVTPIVGDEEIVGTIDYDVFGATDGAVICRLLFQAGRMSGRKQLMSLQKHILHFRQTILKMVATQD